MTMQTLICRIHANVHDDDAWESLFDVLIGQGNTDGANALLNSRHQLRRDAASFAYGRMLGLVKADRRAEVGHLYAAAGADGAFRGIFAYGLALFATEAFDLSAAVHLLREALYLTSHCCDQIFAHEQHFSKQTLGQILQQTALIEDAEYSEIPYDPPAIDLPAPHPSPLLVFACCCDSYFRAYGERFVAQLSAALPQASYLIHVLNPSPAAHAMGERLRRDFPHGTISFEECREDGALYASRRFMLAPLLRQLHAGDLLIMDVDSVFTGPIADLVAASRRAGMAYFGNAGELLPSLVVSAAYLYLPRASPVADRFLASVAAYLHRKLAEPVVFWTVDQAALFRGVCLLEARRNDALDLSTVFPEGVMAICADDGHVVPEDMRRARRQGGDLQALSYDEKRRPILRRRQ